MSMEEHPDFYTQKGYQMRRQEHLTGAMEDYLEMICRLAQSAGYVRTGDPAQQLHVRPPSASKMVGHLRERGLVSFERYGLIRPTAAGWQIGRRLLRRHEVLLRFFQRVNGTEDELELVEQVEHAIDERTVDNLEAWLGRMDDADQA